jgi:hypothetical protein
MTSSVPAKRMRLRQPRLQTPQPRRRLSQRSQPKPAKRRRNKRKAHRLGHRARRLQRWPRTNRQQSSPIGPPRNRIAAELRSSLANGVTAHLNYCLRTSFRKLALTVLVRCSASCAHEKRLRDWLKKSLARLNVRPTLGDLSLWERKTLPIAIFGASAHPPQAPIWL